VYGDIASNGTSFVWTDPSYEVVGEFDVGETPITLADGATTPESVEDPGPIAIDSSGNVYWFQPSATTGYTDLGVAVLEAADSDNTLGSQPGSASGIAVVSGAVVWTAVDVESGTTGVGTIRCPVTECLAGAVDATSSPSIGLTVAPDFSNKGIVWSNISSGVIMDSKSTFTAAVTSGYTAYFVASNSATSSYVYWTEQNGNDDTYNIVFAENGGPNSPPTALVDDVYNPVGELPTGLATDGTFVYFAIGSSIYTAYVNAPSPQTPELFATCPSGEGIEHLKYVPNAEWTVAGGITTGPVGALIFDDTVSIYEVVTPLAP